MIGEDRQPRIAEHMKFLNLICFVLVMSTIVYVVVAWFVTDGPGRMQPLAGSLPGAVPGTVAVVGIALLLIAPVLHARLLQRAEGPSLDGDIAPVLAGYQMAIFLGFILREGAAIVGLMLTLLTGQGYWTYGLAAAAVIAMFTGWPRESELRQLLESRPG